MANKYWWIWIIAIGALVVIGMLFQKSYPIFSISSTRSCDSWLANEGLSGTPPITWYYTSSQVRCITGLTSVGSGCKIDYSSGECPSCTPSCSGKSCGDNGCGGSCGTCSTGYTCSNYQCVSSGGCTSGQTQSCTASNGCTGTQTCSSGAWGTCTTSLQKCSDGSCQTSCGTGGSCLLQDSNSNGKVDRSELGQAIQAWVSG